MLSIILFYAVKWWNLLQPKCPVYRTPIKLSITVFPLKKILLCSLDVFWSSGASWCHLHDTACLQVQGFLMLGLLSSWTYSNMSINITRLQVMMEVNWRHYLLKTSVLNFCNFWDVLKNWNSGRVKKSLKPSLSFAFKMH